MSIEVTDMLLQQLSERWLDTLEERYPSMPKEPYRFSWRFWWRMWWLCRRADWDYMHGKEMSGFGAKSDFRWTKRSLAAFLAAALGTTAAMAYAAQWFKMIREEYARYSTIRYEQVEDGPIPGGFFCYTLGYVPEGFTLEEEVEFENYHEESYASEDGRLLHFYQISLGDATFDLDTEKVKPVQIRLDNGQPAWYLDNAVHKVIYWDDGNYSFQVSGYLSRDELVKISSNITIK